MAYFSQVGTFFCKILFNTTLSDFFCHLQHNVRLILRNLMLPISILHFNNSWRKTEVAKSSLHSLFSLLLLCSLPKLTDQRFRSEPLCPFWFYSSFLSLPFLFGKSLAIYTHASSYLVQSQNFSTAFLRPEVRFSAWFYLSVVSCGMVTLFFLAFLGFCRTFTFVFLLIRAMFHWVILTFNATSCIWSDLRVGCLQWVSPKFVNLVLLLSSNPTPKMMKAVLGWHMYLFQSIMQEPCLVLL